MAYRPISLTPIRKLRPNKRNARTHSRHQIRQIADSISRFGWTYPILVDESFAIIAGHGRYFAAIERQIKDVPVIVMSGLNDAEKRALAIADNKIAINAGWDRAALAAELGELSSLLPDIQLDLSITGFEPAEFDLLCSDFTDAETPPEDIPPLAATSAISEPGDLWLMDCHRLCCGDARTRSDVSTLMHKRRAAMVFADPPYNVSISDVVNRGKTKHREFKAASGEMTPAQFTRFLAGWMELAAEHSADGSIHFVCMDWRHLGETLAAGTQVYSELKNLVAWVKSNAGQGSFYRSQHELIFVFKNGNAPHQNNVELGRFGRSRSNVWQYAGVNSFRSGRMDELSIHPTVKPVALVADAIKDCTRRQDIVFDPFMGSGTTIIAAERVGRQAYGLEIDPLYVDTAIRRWQEFTGRDAVLEVTGATFDEISKLRRTKVPGRRT
ncbi:site-specific DNA-methyltransferase [Tardiphaga sp.]|jgi:DNA modification methylase|uniref:site-specific DNA-methyltransferase n=1 Tax=Tardiphaga sp. TaxID=1926292 RepID=UPI0037DA08E1